MRRMRLAAILAAAALLSALALFLMTRDTGRVPATQGLAPPVPTAPQDSAPAPAPVAAAPAEWRYSVERDPPDAVTSEASVAAVEGDGALVVACSGGGLMQVYFKSGQEAAEDSSDVPIRYRVDGAAPVEKNGWYVHRDIGFHLFDEGGGVADQPLLRQIADARTVALEQPVAMRFNVAGAAAAIERVRSQCWVNDPSEAPRPTA